MNIVNLIHEGALNWPDKKAVVHPQKVKGIYHNRFYTFATFSKRVHQLSHRLVTCGVKKGDRVLLLVTPSLDFSVMTFALFQIGAIPVLIDPGMGIKKLLSSIKEIEASVMIGVSKARWLKRFSSAFSSVKIVLAYEKMIQGLDPFQKDYPVEDLLAEDLSCILFTSGGTGKPKGVLYTHGILSKQTQMLQKHFGLNDKESDLPGFALFALFTLSMGMTSVIPDMDPSQPSKCNPKNLVRHILENQISFVAGSPAIWKRVADYCLEHRIQLPSVKWLVMFGAPVELKLHLKLKKILPFGDTHTPYGATEFLPVSSISGQEVLSYSFDKTLAGQGVCVGKAFKENQVIVSDIPCGEILVHGPTMSLGYFKNQEAQHRARSLREGKIYHHMGDNGFIDDNGYLWFLGRVVHEVKYEGKSYYPTQIEAIFNQYLKFSRSALIFYKGRPALALEGREVSKNVLSNIARSHELTSGIEDFFFVERFPVDVRHNIKIDRKKLGEWVR